MLPVGTMGLTTANDAVERDPASYQLYGTNDSITSEQNSNSNGSEVWTLISSGPLSLPGVLPNGGGDDARFTQTLVPINSPAAFTSYRLIFPTVKSPTAANSMQIADIQFYGIPEPSDFDEDGDVDGNDLANWKAGFGDSGAATHMQGDADADMDVDGADFLVWQRQLGSVPAVAATAVVPEPETFLLFIVASTGFRRTARQKRQELINE